MDYRARRHDVAVKVHARLFLRSDCVDTRGPCSPFTDNAHSVISLDALDNVISGNGPSSEMLTCQSQIPEWAKTEIPKSEDLSRSLEMKTIWTFDMEFPTIFNNKSCTYITFKSAVKHRQLSYGYPRGHTVNLAEATTQDTYFSLYNISLDYCHLIGWFRVTWR